MGAPKGNKFWELRSKHGRDKLFKTPQLLWDAACEYFQWCVDNPFIEQDFMNSKDGPVEIGRNKMRPFTMQGLTSYLNCNVQYFNDFENALKNNKDDLQKKDFSAVIIRIRQTIYNQKFSGAASGFFNANIIARDLGLKENSEVALSNPDGSLNKREYILASQKDIENFNKLLEQMKLK